MITYQLGQLGFSRYSLSIDGNNYAVTDDRTGKIMKRYQNTKYSLFNDRLGKSCFISLRKMLIQLTGQLYYVDNNKDLPNEEWRQIVLDRSDNKSICKYYKVSNLGRVKSYCKVNVRILKPYKNQQGYCRVEIKGNPYSVHRLVALAFVPNDNPEEKNTVDHINGDKADNRASNLQWLSRIDNIKKGGKSGPTDKEYS